MPWSLLERIGSFDEIVSWAEKFSVRRLAPHSGKVQPDDVPSAEVTLHHWVSKANRQHALARTRSCSSLTPPFMEHAAWYLGNDPSEKPTVRRETSYE